MLKDQTIPTVMVYRKVANYSWKFRWAFFPGKPAMTKINCRRFREVHHRGHRLQVMLPVNHVRRSANLIKLGDLES